MAHTHNTSTHTAIHSIYDIQLAADTWKLVTKKIGKGDRIRPNQMEAILFASNSASDSNRIKAVHMIIMAGVRNRLKCTSSIYTPHLWYQKLQIFSASFAWFDHIASCISDVNTRYLTFPNYLCAHMREFTVYFPIQFWRGKIRNNAHKKQHASI